LYQALQDQQAQHQNATVQTSSHASHTQQAVAVLNLGGFANLTVMPNRLSKPADALSQIQGGDCGPANVLMDAWARQHFGCVMDRDGRIAAQGQVHQGLLKILLQHPFFALPWPKSTGRDDFTEVWLAQCLQSAQAAEKTKGAAPLREVDVMATLLQLTVDTVVACVPHYVQSVYVCGGGSYNPVLLAALQRALQCRSQQPISVMLFDALSLPAQAVEACAFAWLAAQYMQQKPGNCMCVTGAKQQAVLGALHWGTKTTA
jgi:anhydro-N-acetylmuramic acid kinase